jgi:hypothetical protein
MASQVQSRQPTMPWDDEIEWATVMVRAGLGLDQSPASSNRHVEEYIKITRLD